MGKQSAYIVFGDPIMEEEETRPDTMEEREARMIYPYGVNERVVRDPEIIDVLLTPNAAFDPNITTTVKTRAMKLVEGDWVKPGPFVKLPCHVCALRMIKSPEAVCTHTDADGCIMPVGPTIMHVFKDLQNKARALHVGGDSSLGA